MIPEFYQVNRQQPRRLNSVAVGSAEEIVKVHDQRRQRIGPNGGPQIILQFAPRAAGLRTTSRGQKLRK